MSIAFSIRLADLNIGVCALYESTKSFCRDYIIEEARTVDFHVSVEPVTIETERKKAEQNLIVEGKEVRSFSDEELERSALYRQIAEHLPEYQAFVFHGSAVSMEEKGYIFSAQSGVGKSTHASLWKEAFGDRLRYINDDKPVIRIVGGVPVVYGSPWDGKHHRSENNSVCIRGISFLSRGEENEINKIKPEEAFVLMLMQTYRPENERAFEKTLEMLDSVCSEVPIYRMRCNRDLSAAQTIYAGMA